MTEWLVAKINPLLERRASRQIHRVGGASFCPKYFDKLRGVERPLYPSYIFIHSPGRWYYLLGIDSIIGIVANRSDRAPFRSRALDEKVEELFRSVDPTGNLPAPPVAVRRSKFLRGDRVRVLNGIFSDCFGVFDRFYDGRSRIKLDLLGASITLDQDDLAPLGAAGR